MVLDPPRAGLHADVIKSILQWEPSRIIYVSCNPATQARDVSLFSEKYFLKKIKAVDMFPYTNHVESVGLLLKKA
jgi:23S rRNA (uracil1939-C5)-methyltransferase